MPGQHAPLSASASSRWLNCPASLNLTKDMPDEISAYAAEGTLAHENAAYKLSVAFKAQLSGEVPPVPQVADTEMLDYVDQYTKYVSELIQDNSILFVEQKVDYSEYTGVAGSMGTADCIVINGDTLNVVDFKYGMGVPVSADNNSQMMLYALGAYWLLSDVYDINSVNMSIFQPRIHNISSTQMSVKELLDWANKVLKPKALEAFTGSSDYKCGKWCQFCRAKCVCRARAEANLSQARLDFALPATLSDTEISVLLTKVDDITSWCNDVKEFAYVQALNGKKWEGFKLVAGRSARKYTDESQVAEVVQAAGYDPWEHKVLGITAMNKLLGKSQFDALLNAYIVKAPGKPALVPATDKRKEIGSADSAIQDFR